jgi:hypothetical protein
MRALMHAGDAQREGGHGGVHVFVAMIRGFLHALAIVQEEAMMPCSGCGGDARPVLHSIMRGATFRMLKYVQLFHGQAHAYLRRHAHTHPQVRAHNQSWLALLLPSVAHAHAR